MSFRTSLRALAALFALLPLASAAAQLNPNAIKPGRDPRQPIDSAYTAKIKEYTTETFFLSPLVDYLPASKTVPTPMATLGDIAGGPTKLPYSSEVYEYMRLLAKSAPKRVKVWTIGKTEEGREHIAVAVASVHHGIAAKSQSDCAVLQGDFVSARCVRLYHAELLCDRRHLQRRQSD